jgi:hypothetical protein
MSTYYDQRRGQVSPHVSQQSKSTSRGSTLERFPASSAARIALGSKTSTNVGDEQGDALCIARMFNAEGRRVNVIDMLIAGNLKPRESSGNVVDYAGRATSGKTKCDAYDPGALREIG